MNLDESVYKSRVGRLWHNPPKEFRRTIFTRKSFEFLP